MEWLNKDGKEIIRRLLPLSRAAVGKPPSLALEVRWEKNGRS